MEGIEQFYQDVINLCEQRLAEISQDSNLNSNTDSHHHNVLSLNLNFNELNSTRTRAIQLVEIKEQLSICLDNDLLIALRDEFSRKLRVHEVNEEPPPPLPPQRMASTEQHYFRNKNDNDNIKAFTMHHFDGQRIARQLIQRDAGNTQLLLTGRNDSEMCQWNLEEALIAEDLGDEISETEFNRIWFENGGFPYVRPTRKVRRFLTSALIKKLPASKN